MPPTGPTQLQPSVAQTIEEEKAETQPSSSSTGTVPLNTTTFKISPSPTIAVPPFNPNKPPKEPPSPFYIVEGVGMMTKVVPKPVPQKISNELQSQVITVPDNSIDDDEVVELDQSQALLDRLLEQAKDCKFVGETTLWKCWTTIVAEIKKKRLTRNFEVLLADIEAKC